MKAKKNHFILGMVFIFISIKLEMRVMERNNFAWISDLISVIQVGLVVFIRRGKFPLLSNFLRLGAYQGIFLQTYLITYAIWNCMTIIGKTVLFLWYLLMDMVVILIWSFWNKYVMKITNGLSFLVFLMENHCGRWYNHQNRTEHTKLILLKKIMR